MRSRTWLRGATTGRTVYPVSTRSGSELGLYARLCNAVEGNTTFYAEPSAETVARWRDQTPESFRFAFKLPREVTHDRRLQDVALPVRSFLDRIEPLGDRIGPVQAQLPPAFGPEGVEVLLAFVRRLPLDWPWAIELRHPGWFDDGDAHRAGPVVEHGERRHGARDHTEVAHQPLCAAEGQAARIEPRFEMAPAEAKEAQDAA